MMLKVYFGEWGDGRLKRLQYFGYYLLLMLLMVLMVAGIVFSMGAVENMMGGDIAATQEAMMEHIGLPLAIGMMIFFIAMVIAEVNILAKRIRDMGLPPLWTILGLIALSIVINILFPGQEVVGAAVVQSVDGNTTAAIAAKETTQSLVAQVYDAIVFLSLLFIPSDTFKAKGY
jgi:uncharacterized membrane protein YhaH (DUF805 family)